MMESEYSGCPAACREGFSVRRTHSAHQRTVDAVCMDADLFSASLGFSPEGHSDETAQKSRSAFGSNELRTIRTDGLAVRFLRAFANPFSLVLLILAVVSLLTEMLPTETYRSRVTPSGLIIAMLLISGAIRFIQEWRAKRAADRLLHLFDADVRVFRNGSWTRLSAQELVVGDRIRFHAGDRIPADVRIATAEDLFVSQSVLTGESSVMEKTAAPLPHLPRRIEESSDIVFAGSSVIGGTGEGIVTAVGADTVFGGLESAIGTEKKGFDRGANSIAWVLVRFAAVLVPLVFLTCGFTQGRWGAAFLFALSVGVGLIPEMLPMVINACLSRGSAVMGHKDTIVRSINAMQGFGSMDVLCLDKTGTLTRDEIQLEYYMDILGNECGRVWDYAYLNSLYHTGMANHLDQAILRLRDIPGKADACAELARSHPKLDEIPFDYERRFASVLVENGADNLLIVKGSVDDICRRCRYTDYKGRIEPMSADAGKSVRAVVDDMREDGMKVLAVAYRHMSKKGVNSGDILDLVLVGYLAFFDVPKRSAARAVEQLRQLHVPVKLLTGDHLRVALSVCRRVGIPTESVLTGKEWEALTDDELPMAAERTTVFAELTPLQKAQIVELLQDNGHTVGFLGDGMNDLPAIRRADVGISAESAAEAVREAADVILLRKDLGILEEGILEGRKTFANMSKYIRITASSNLGNIMAIAVAAVCLPFFPMASIQLLLLNLLYDVLCLILPWDSVDEELYTHPRPWSGKTLGRFMRFFGPISTVFDLIAFAFLYFVFCPLLCGGAFGTLGSAAQLHFIALFQTGWFLESMWTQVLILHLLRTQRLPFVQSRPALPVLLTTAAGIILYTLLPFTPLGTLLGLTAMPPVYFIFLAGIVILYLIAVTIAKKIYLQIYRELI